MTGEQQQETEMLLGFALPASSKHCTRNSSMAALDQLMGFEGQLVGSQMQLERLWSITRLFVMVALCLILI